MASVELKPTIATMERCLKELDDAREYHAAAFLDQSIASLCTKHGFERKSLIE